MVKIAKTRETLKLIRISWKQDLQQFHRNLIVERRRIHYPSAPLRLHHESGRIMNMLKNKSGPPTKAVGSECHIDLFQKTRCKSKKKNDHCKSWSVDFRFLLKAEQTAGVWRMFALFTAQRTSLVDN